MFYVQHDLLLLTIVSYEGVDRVTVWYPANETRVWRERNDGVTLNAVRGCVMCGWVEGEGGGGGEEEEEVEDEKLYP